MSTDLFGLPSFGGSSHMGAGRYIKPIAPPTISGFAPGHAAEGASVVITGTEFLSATAVSVGPSAPYLNAPDYTIDSDTQITVLVPVGAVTGVWFIDGPGGSVASGDTFTVDP